MHAQEEAEKQSYIFTEFGAEDALDTALGLLEQMQEESQVDLGEVTDDD